MIYNRLTSSYPASSEDETSVAINNAFSEVVNGKEEQIQITNWTDKALNGVYIRKEEDNKVRLYDVEGNPISLDIKIPQQKNYFCHPFIATLRLSRRGGESYININFPCVWLSVSLDSENQLEVEGFPSRGQYSGTYYFAPILEFFLKDSPILVNICTEHIEYGEMPGTDHSWVETLPAILGGWNSISAALNLYDFTEQAAIEFELNGGTLTLKDPENGNIYTFDLRTSAEEWVPEV